MAEENITDSVSEKKQKIRDVMRLERGLLKPAEIRQAARAVVGHLKSLLLAFYPDKTRNQLRIAVYAAIRNELDLAETWPLLLDLSCRLYFPAVVLDQLVLGALPAGIMPHDWLKPGCLGIMEPPPDERCLTLPCLDLIMLPGLAFDRRGNRIGWGKAYYDGLLARLPAETIRVGVGYDFQIVPELPADRHDQMLDMLLTSSGWMRCAGRNG